MSALCMALPALEDGPYGPVRCRTGDAVRTAPGGSVRHSYKGIIHTVAPFASSETWGEDLRACWHRSLDLAWDEGDATVAFPLLGAGARGATTADACRVAVEALVSWRPPATPPTRPPVHANGAAGAVMRAQDVEGAVGGPSGSWMGHVRERARAGEQRDGGRGEDGGGEAGGSRSAARKGEGRGGAGGRHGVGEEGGPGLELGKPPHVQTQTRPQTPPVVRIGVQFDEHLEVFEEACEAVIERANAGLVGYVPPSMVGRPEGQWVELEGA